MTIEDLPSGATAGVDANILIYHFTGQSEACSNFLLRVEAAEIYGMIGAGTVAETLHRLMMLEAMNHGHIGASNPAHKLRNKPTIVRALQQYASAGRAVLGMGLKVVPLDEKVLEASQEIRDRYGLLVNDSILVATLLRQGVSHLVTADHDFTRVAELHVYHPTDL